IQHFEWITAQHCIKRCDLRVPRTVIFFPDKDENVFQSRDIPGLRKKQSRIPGLKICTGIGSPTPVVRLPSSVVYLYLLELPSRPASVPCCPRVGIPSRTHYHDCPEGKLTEERKVWEIPDCGTASLSFPSQDLCLVCSGGRTLYLLRCGNRSAGQPWTERLGLAMFLDCSSYEGSMQIWSVHQEVCKYGVSTRKYANMECPPGSMQIWSVHQEVCKYGVSTRKYANMECPPGSMQIWSVHLEVCKYGVSTRKYANMECPPGSMQIWSVHQEVCKYGVSTRKYANMECPPGSMQIWSVHQEVCKYGVSTRKYANMECPPESMQIWSVHQEVCKYGVSTRKYANMECPPGSMQIWSVHQKVCKYGVSTRKYANMECPPESMQIWSVHQEVCKYGVSTRKYANMECPPGNQGCWAQSSHHSLTGHSYPTYATIEHTGSALYLVSEKPFTFVSKDVEMENVSANGQPPLEEEEKSLYTYHQTPEDITLGFCLPEGTPKSEISVRFGIRHLTVHLMGEVALDSRLCRELEVEACTWTLQDSRIPGGTLYCILCLFLYLDPAGFQVGLCIAFFVCSCTWTLQDSRWDFVLHSLSVLVPGPCRIPGFQVGLCIAFFVCSCTWTLQDSRIPGGTLYCILCLFLYLDPAGFQVGLCIAFFVCSCTWTLQDSRIPGGTLYCILCLFLYLDPAGFQVGLCIAFFVCSCTWTLQDSSDFLLFTSKQPPINPGTNYSSIHNPEEGSEFSVEHPLLVDILLGGHSDRHTEDCQEPFSTQIPPLGDLALFIMEQGDSRGREIADPALASEVHAALRHLVAEKQGEVGRRPAPNLQQLEECDAAGEGLVLERLEPGGAVTHRADLLGHNWLFGLPSSGQLCLRHDVDGLVWELQPSPALHHIATFPALGYVQASKTDRKFTCCPPDFSYAAICDPARHLFIYHQPSKPAECELRNRRAGATVQRVARQHLAYLDDCSAILGLRASPSCLFALGPNTLYAVKIS
ncbi:NUDCD1, partial [Cordylochernes scorpioides]